MHPVLFSLGPLTLYTLGFSIVLSLSVGLFFFWKRLSDRGYDPEFIFDVALLAITGGVFGSRLVFVLLHPKLFWPNLFQMFNFFGRPGFVFYGAVLGGAFAIIWLCRQQKKASRPILDAAAMSLSLAHAVALLGAFLSGSVYGAKTALPWGVQMVGLAGKRHPVQLLEAALEVGLFFILYQRYRKPHQPGSIAFLYIVAYALGRLVIEFLRGDSVYWFGIKSQWFLSLLIILLALVYAVKRDLLTAKQHTRLPNI